MIRKILMMFVATKWKSVWSAKVTVDRRYSVDDIQRDVKALVKLQINNKDDYRFVIDVGNGNDEVQSSDYILQYIPGAKEALKDAERMMKLMKI
jgi:hypothetical protein